LLRECPFSQLKRNKDVKPVMKEAGCARDASAPPKSLDLLKIRAKSLKMLAIILKIFGKIAENPNKIPKYRDV